MTQFRTNIYVHKMYLFTTVLCILAFIQFGQSAENVNEEEDSDLDDLNFEIAKHVLNQANKPVWFGLENPVNPFIGRISELSELKWGQLDKKITIITGARGVGKTELSRKYAQEMKHDNISNILWLDSTTHDSLISDFKDLAVQIGKTLEAKTLTSVLRETFDFFRNRKTLFILDHASSDNLIVQNLKRFMKDSKAMQIIVTSRDEDWGEEYKILKLKNFQKENSIEYIKKVLKKEIDLTVIDSSADKLSDLVKNLPIALKEATAYIIRKNTVVVSHLYTVDDYIRDYINFELPQQTTTTTQKVPTDTEFEETLVDKLEQEGQRIGNQISSGAKETWEKISDESTRIGGQITGEAARAGERISGEAARVEEQVRNFFSGWGR